MIDFFKRNEVFSIIFIQNGIMMLGFGLISPILPQYAQSFGVSITMVGLLITAFGVARLIVDLPTGSLADRFGRRLVLISGPLIMTIGSLACGLATNYWQLISFRFIQGTGSAIFMTGSNIMLADIAPPKSRGRIMSWYQGSFFLGTGLGPTVGGFTAQYFGLRAPFFVLASLAALATVWAYLRLPETRPKTQVSQVPTGDAQLSKLAKPPNTGLKPLLRDLNFILISVVTLGIFFNRTGAYNQILPLVASDRLGLNTGQIGMSLSVISIFNFITLLICGSLSDRFGRKALITPGVILSVVSLVMLSQTHSYWFLIITCVIWGIGTGTAGPVPAAYVVDIIPRENYASSVGLYRAAGDLGYVVGPILLGWLADIKGYNFSLLFDAAFLLLSVLIFQTLAKEPSRRQH